MSSIIKHSSSTIDISSEEDSGWTTYFEDSISLSSVSISSSLVSNATSLPPKNIGHNEQTQEFSVNENTNKRDQVSTKKKNVIAVLVDDALEDTATFPPNNSKEKGNTSNSQNKEKKKKNAVLMGKR